MEKKLLKIRQSKDKNSSIIDNTLMKLHMHNHTMVIYIHYKFHEIPSIGYLVMAEDRKTDGRMGWDGMDGQCQTYIPLPSAGLFKLVL